MSLTAMAWLAAVAGLAVLTLSRPAYGFALYLLTFFANPTYWWWGDELPESIQWNLYSGWIFLIAGALHSLSSPKDEAPKSGSGWVNIFAIGMVVNATAVHLLLAPDYAVSFESYLLLVKFVLLYFMIVASARTPRDYRLLIWSIVLGATYVGFEITVNDRGHFATGRLEGAGVPGAKMANNLASLFVTAMPLAGSLFFVGTRWEKILAALSGPFILNVVLLCNSRAAFLGMAASACAFLIAVPGRARKQALYGLSLAGIVTFFLLGDPDILARFGTIFVSSEDQLDHSAASRLTYWTAGLNMIADHPLGAGGYGFKRAYASQYLAEVGVDVNARSVHNGFINDAAEWGLQGLALHLLFIGSGVWLMLRVSRYRNSIGDRYGAVTCAAMIGAMVAFLITCVFGDFLDAEWGYWIVALMVGYARLYGPEAEKEPAKAKFRLERAHAPPAIPQSARQQLREVTKTHG
jgi:O-antigen ligase/polysaccharide polymerase Wzy-like membrane protein